MKGASTKLSVPSTSGIPIWLKPGQWGMNCSGQEIWFKSRCVTQVRPPSLILGFGRSIETVSFCETWSNKDVFLELPGAGKNPALEWSRQREKGGNREELKPETLFQYLDPATPEAHIHQKLLTTWAHFLLKLVCDWFLSLIAKGADWQKTQSWLTEKLLH